MQHRVRTPLAVITVLATLVLGVSAVAALTGRNSREFVAGSASVKGSSEAGDFAGIALAVGNFDGDRYEDVLLGIPLEDRESIADVGQIQVFYGSRKGVSAGRDVMIHQGSSGVVGDAAAGDLFGAAMTVADFNNDGYDDAAIGVPGKTVEGVVGAGSVVVLFGSGSGLSGRGSRSFTQLSVVADSAPGSQHRFGHSLTAGDFNGDTFLDLAIGAPGDSSAGAAAAGGVGIIHGSEAGFGVEIDTWLTQDTDGVPDVSEPGDRFGWSLAAGHFNADGAADLAVGVPSEGHSRSREAGLVEVFSGSDVGLVAAASILSENTPGVSSRSKARDGFGSALAAGDFNGDNRSDLAIGIPGKSRKSKPAAGSVQVLLGSDLGLTGSPSKGLTQAAKALADKPGAGDSFGWAVTVGDFNGNGRDDLAVGVPGETVDQLLGAGVTHVFFGIASGIGGAGAQTWQPGVRGVPGRAEANAGVGRALAAGDLDGDGRDDLVVGNPGRSVGSAGAAGAFFVLYG